MPDDSLENLEAGAIAVQTAPEEHAQIAEGSTKPKREPPYHVIIWNDETHTGEYVIDLLMTIFGHPFQRAEQIMLDVDELGKGIAYTTHKELAELKREQILAYGPDWRLAAESTGPIYATIEPAPD